MKWPKPLELAYDPRPPHKRGKRMRCKWCHRAHTTDRCPDPGNRTRWKKLYGSMGPNREYVPPQGLNVRVMQLPPTVHGEDLSRILKELDEEIC